MKITNDIAWITGGSGGIGEAIAYELAALGCSVCIGYYSNQRRALEIVDQCRHCYKVEAIAIYADVKDPNVVQKAYDELVTQLGPPTILVHAAGVSKISLFQDYTESDLNEAMNFIKGAFYVSQAVVPYLIKNQNGRLIFISSIWGESGGACEVLYSTVKGAQNGLIKALSKELAPSGITVNTVAPGAIKTKMLINQLDKNDEIRLIEQIPAARFGKPKEVASLVTYLCSEDASYLTGQNIQVHGGWNG